MDSGTIVVLVLIFAAAVFLVFFERNSRRNQAKFKSEPSANTEPDRSSERPSQPENQQESK